MSKWPDEVPVLEAGDMCISEIEVGPCRCLYGHACAVFGRDGDSQTKGALGTALVDAHTELGTGVPDINRQSCRANIYATYPGYEKFISLEAIARVWNRAMAHLGYVRLNPECDRNGNLKPV